MNKLEALAVLHEISNAVKESASTSVIVSEGSQVSHILTGGYEIKMKIELDNYSRDAIKDIMHKYNLYMKEQNGYVIILSIGD